MRERRRSYLLGRWQVLFLESLARVDVTEGNSRQVGREVSLHVRVPLR